MGNSATYFKEVFQITDQPLTPPCPSVVDVIADPRSPTAEFTRTPIEVGMPIRRCHRRNRTMSEVALEAPGPMNNDTYLRSRDIDEELEFESFATKFHKLHILHTDPRSPTAGIVRTPIQVVPYNNEQSLDKLNSPVDSLKTCVSMENLVLSPNELDGEPALQLNDPRSPSTEVVRTPIQVSIWKEENETEECTPKTNKVPSAKRDKENEDCLAKKLFGTPDWKDTSLQVRTPLRTVAANGNSPYQMLKVKQSRGVNLELGRLSGIENTPPPCLNKYDLASTKLKIHNSSSQWSQDNTFVI